MTIEQQVDTKTALSQAVRRFAEAVAETDQYRAVDEAYYTFAKDGETQQMLKEFQEKYNSLRAMIMLNALSEEDKKTLQQLQAAYTHQPSVIRYSEAQRNFQILAQTIGDQITEGIGIDFGLASSSGGCCG